MLVEYDDDVLTVARLLIDRFGSTAHYWAMSRLKLGDRGELDAWREVVSAIEDLQAGSTAA
jgi:hypothetical protein